MKYDRYDRVLAVDFHSLLFVERKPLKLSIVVMLECMSARVYIQICMYSLMWTKELMHVCVCVFVTCLYFFCVVSSHFDR